MEKIVGIAVAALLVVGLMFWLGHDLGKSKPSLDASAQIDSAHQAQLDAKESKIVLYEQRIDGLNADVANLGAEVKELKKQNNTLRNVCIALGAAVVAALFVGTLMGAKGRRDALRVCNDRDVPTE